MIVIDNFLDRIPSRTYKCRDFCREVWLSAFDEDMADRMPLFLTGSGNITLNELRSLTLLVKPENPCFVLYQRKHVIPHIGIYVRGGILHLRDDGAAYDSVAYVERRFSKVSYYK